MESKEDKPKAKRKYAKPDLKVYGNFSKITAMMGPKGGQLADGGMFPSTRVAEMSGGGMMN